MNFAPSPSDRAAAVVSLGLELGSSGIVSIECPHADQRTTFEVQKKAKEQHIAYKSTSVILSGSPFDVFANITNALFQLRNLPSALVLLDCDCFDIWILSEAARKQEYNTETMLWLVTRESALSGVPCLQIPTGTFGLRSSSSRGFMVYDALSLLNRTFFEDPQSANRHTSGDEAYTKANHLIASPEILFR